MTPPVISKVANRGHVHRYFSEGSDELVLHGQKQNHPTSHSLCSAILTPSLLVPSAACQTLKYVAVTCPEIGGPARLASTIIFQTAPKSDALKVCAFQKCLDSQTKD